MKCIADMNGVTNEDDAPDTSYYQWITFVTVFQAALFYMPHKIWKYLEGGLMYSFGGEAR